jgi:hypothetical protein
VSSGRLAFGSSSRHHLFSTKKFLKVSNKKRGQTFLRRQRSGQNKLECFVADERLAKINADEQSLELTFQCSSRVRSGLTRKY